MNKKTMYILIIGIIILLLGWSIFSYIFNRSIASPEYSVLEKREGYEIRSYKPYIVAQVEVVGSYNEAMSQGFRVLADYIFGNNTKQESIDMTAPVVESQSEKIKMTAPVLVAENEVLEMTAPVTEKTNEQNRIVSFVMPFEYTLETLPKPNNPDVKILTQEARKVAVLRFSWFRNESRISKKKQELLSMLGEDKIISKGAVEYAGYNAPFNPPWLNRNEVMVEVE